MSVPPEVEAAIDKRSSMAAIGNLNDYVKFQMAQGMAQGGGAGAPAEMAMGFAMAQEMMKNTNLSPSGAPQPATPAAAAPAFQQLDIQPGTLQLLMEGKPATTDEVGAAVCEAL